MSNALTIITENKEKLAKAIEDNKEIIKFNSNLKKFVENFLELGTQQYLLSQVDTNALVKLCIDLTKAGFNVNPFKKEVYIIPFEVKIDKETKIKVPAPVIPLNGWKKFYARAGFILDVQKIWKLSEEVAKKESEMSYIELASIKETDKKYRDEHFLGWEVSLIDIKKELDPQRVFVSVDYARAALKNSQTPIEFELEGLVHKAIRKAQKSFILPPDREVKDIEEVEVLENRAYDASNPINAQVIEKKQNNKVGLTKYLLQKGIPKQAFKQFADYCLANGLDLKSEETKEKLLEDVEVLDWLVDTFLNK